MVQASAKVRELSLTVGERILLLNAIELGSIVIGSFGAFEKAMSDIEPAWGLVVSQLAALAEDQVELTTAGSRRKQPARRDRSVEGARAIRPRVRLDGLHSDLRRPFDSPRPPPTES